MVAVPESLRIALLLDNIESDYHTEIISGVLRAARPSRVRTLIVPGGWLGPVEQPVARNFVYDLLQKARLDGLVILGGSLSNYCGLARFQEWVRRFGPMPCIAVGVDVPELPNVRVDNAVGVHQLVCHLIDQHGRRRIAFISGPAESPEAEQRKGAYERALRDRQIDADEHLIVPGGLGRENGTSAMATLLDQPHFGPASVDAVVAVNDDVALGALEELNRRGMAVPELISVVGFDDAASARAANPPLSTVNQRVELQAFTATKALIDALEGKQKLSSVMLDSEAVFRSSCGCLTHFENDSAAIKSPTVALARSCRLALIERHRTITAELARAAQGRLVGMPGWESRLLEALTRDLASADGAGFVHQIERLVRRHLALGNDVMACHDVLTTLRLQALACAALEPESRPRIEDLCQESRLTLARIGAEVGRERQHTMNLRLRFITQSCLSMLDRGSMAELVLKLEEHLPALGISSFMLSQFRATSQSAAELEVLARRTARLGFKRDAVLSAGSLGLDAAMEQEDSLVLLPLECGARPVGLAALAWGAQNPLHYEQLRELLSSALLALRSRAAV